MKKKRTKTGATEQETPPHNRTAEATAYLRGSYAEFLEQKKRYGHLTVEMLALQARVDLAERNLALTRDHLAITVSKTQDALPNDWAKALASARFVGVRLADACVAVLQERRRLSPTELLRAVNDGMFRFRTNAPLREIHAALLRHPHAKKVDGVWVWTGPGKGEEQQRLRLVGNSEVVLERPPEVEKE
jgi:hypothetical protein